jgi:hypothetical protein
MKKEIGFNPVLIGQKIVVIGNDVIDAGHRFVGELHTAIDDEDIPVDLNDGAFFTIFIETA